jgi:hypothetical protein
MLSVMLGFVSIKDTTQGLNIVMLSFISIRHCAQALDIIMLYHFLIVVLSVIMLSFLTIV